MYEISFSKMLIGRRKISSNVTLAVTRGRWCVLGWRLRSGRCHRCLLWRFGRTRAQGSAGWRAPSPTPAALVPTMWSSWGTVVFTSS